MKQALVSFRKKKIFIRTPLKGGETGGWLGKGA
jgi:hypothetical protein